MGSDDWDCRLLFDPQHQRREFSVVRLANDFPYRLFDNAKIKRKIPFCEKGIFLQPQDELTNCILIKNYLCGGLYQGIIWEHTPMGNFILYFLNI